MDNKDEIEIHNTDTFVDEGYEVEYFNNDGESIGKVITKTSTPIGANNKNQTGTTDTKTISKVITKTSTPIGANNKNQTGTTDTKTGTPSIVTEGTKVTSTQSEIDHKLEDVNQRINDVDTRLASEKQFTTYTDPETGKIVTTQSDSYQSLAREKEQLTAEKTDIEAEKAAVFTNDSKKTISKVITKTGTPIGTNNKNQTGTTDTKTGTSSIVTEGTKVTSTQSEINQVNRELDEINAKLDSTPRDISYKDPETGKTVHQESTEYRSYQDQKSALESKKQTLLEQQNQAPTTQPSNLSSKGYPSSTDTTAKPNTPISNNQSEIDQVNRELDEINAKLDSTPRTTRYYDKETGKLVIKESTEYRTYQARKSELESKKETLFEQQKQEQTTEPANLSSKGYPSSTDTTSAKPTTATSDNQIELDELNRQLDEIESKLESTPRTTRYYDKETGELVIKESDEYKSYQARKNELEAKKASLTEKQTTEPGNLSSKGYPSSTDVTSKPTTAKINNQTELDEVNKKLDELEAKLDSTPRTTRYYDKETGKWVIEESEEYKLYLKQKAELESKKTSLTEKINLETQPTTEPTTESSNYQLESARAKMKSIPEKIAITNENGEREYIDNPAYIDAKKEYEKLLLQDIKSEQTYTYTPAVTSSLTSALPSNLDDLLDKYYEENILTGNYSSKVTELINTIKTQLSKYNETASSMFLSANSNIKFSGLAAKQTKKLYEYVESENKAIVDYLSDVMYGATDEVNRLAELLETRAELKKQIAETEVQIENLESKRASTSRRLAAQKKKSNQISAYYANNLTIQPETTDGNVDIYDNNKKIATFNNDSSEWSLTSTLNFYDSEITQLKEALANYEEELEGINQEANISLQKVKEYENMHIPFKTFA